MLPDCYVYTGAKPSGETIETSSVQSILFRIIVQELEEPSFEW